MLKYRVTNVTARDGKPGRAKFIVEAGRLLQPGDSAPVNRLGRETRDDPDLEVQEGDFPPIVDAPKKQPPAVDDDDDDVPAPPKRAKEEAGPARLVTAVRGRKIVPLNPEPAKEVASAATESNDDAPLMADELDDEIPSAKAPVAGLGGFVDMPPPRSTNVG